MSQKTKVVSRLGPIKASPETDYLRKLPFRKFPVITIRKFPVITISETEIEFPKRSFTISETEIEFPKRILYGLRS